ncbi:MAG: hypothetical protein LBV51_04150 [Acholeplasmatales bacterium]|jgi:hypothetical protein|nr:hypothetical protein [Acholeplasmatales bacterium]
MTVYTKRTNEELICKGFIELKNILRLSCDSFKIIVNIKDRSIYICGDLTEESLSVIYYLLDESSVIGLF